MDESTANGRPPENRLIGERREKLRRLRSTGDAYPNDFRRDALADSLHAEFSGHTGESLEAEPVRVSVAGRMMSKRVMGKASFCHLQDRSGRIQLFVERDRVSTEIHQAFKTWDVGDIVGAAGNLFKTRTGELSVRVEQLRLLVKSLRPLPEKWRGIADRELKLRRRYVDLLMSEKTRRVFEIRTRTMGFVRRFLDALGFGRGGDTDDASHPRRCDRPAVRNPSQRAGSGSVSANRAGTLSETTSGGWVGPRLRDQPQLSQ